MIEILFRMSAPRLWAICAYLLASIGGIKIGGKIILAIGMPRVFEMICLFQIMCGVPVAIGILLIEPIEERIRYLFYNSK